MPRSVPAKSTTGTNARLIGVRISFALETTGGIQVFLEEVASRGKSAREADRTLVDRVEVMLGQRLVNR